MNASGRIRLTIGVVSVLFVAIGLLLYMQHSMTQIKSDSAQLGSKNYTVGVGYSGIIEHQYVDEGSFIKTGDPLFELRSPTLLQAIQDDELQTEQLLYSLTSDNNILITAASNGEVHEIIFREGAFVPANSAIAVINSEGETFISAIYRLNPSDYAKVTTGSPIDVQLPDGTDTRAFVSSVDLELDDAEIYTTIEAKLEDQRVVLGIFTVGTPVETVLYLSGDSWYTQLKNSISTVFLGF